MPPAYGDEPLTSQANEPLRVMWDRMVCDSEQEGRHCSRQPNVRIDQQIMGNDVMYEVPDFMEHNILASTYCCCPIGWLGLVFSMMCQWAKSKGKRKMFQCLWVTAVILFALSVITGLFFIIIYPRFIFRSHAECA